MQWARDMRAREVVIAWLSKMGRPAPDKRLPHIEFAIRLQALLEPQRIEARFEKTRQAAAAYVRGVAQMVGGRDCLATPRLPPVHVQTHLAEKRQGHRQRVFDATHKAARQRIAEKIAKASREVAERIEARRAEMKRWQHCLRP